MNDHLTLVQLLEVMRTARSNWEALLAEAGEARLTEPGVEGDWSVKDIIAHITYYETWAADNVFAFWRGEPRPVSEYKGLEMDERNARLYERIRSKSLAQAWQESQVSFQRSIEAVEGLRDDDLYDPKFTRVPDADWTVFDLIEGDTFEHYNDHTISVRAWLDRTAEHSTKGVTA
ncbi:MAG TPA: ClbS/DfsB family four-helix bundle protein [Anaerolineae bacterium]|nr:ClbS/DfsB family four-helix bundle protein [Anaerolineae bacterium]